MNHYEAAREKYSLAGVDTEAVIEKMMKIPVSLHCWQGDDVKGFDHDRRHSDNRKLSGKGKNSGGADGRYGAGAEPDAGKKEAEPSCQLCCF